MGIFVHPGKNPEKKRLSYKLNGIDDSDDEEEQDVDDESGRRNNFRNKNNNNGYYNNMKQHKVCRKCNDYKPARAHHCSICNECIYKMDHHCPWLDNCVGYQNHRYFLMFILYLFIALTYTSILFLYIDYNPVLFKPYKSILTRLYPATKMLSYVLAIVLFFFNSWNWYLAGTGFTAIEFWGNRQDEKEIKENYFNKDNVRDNLYFIFGTKSYLLMMLPSIRQLPHDGLNYELNQFKIIQKGTQWEQNQSQSNSRINKKSNNIKEEESLQYRKTDAIEEEEYYETEEEQKFNFHNSYNNNQFRNKQQQKQSEYDFDVEGAL